MRSPPLCPFTRDPIKGNVQTEISAIQYFIDRNCRCLIDASSIGGHKEYEDTRPFRIKV